MCSIFLWPLIPRGEGISITINGILIDASQLLPIFLSGIWLFKKFGSISINRNIGIRINTVAVLLFILIILQLLSVLISNNMSVSLRIWILNVFVNYFIFFIVLNEIRTPDECNKMLNFIICSSLILATTIWYEHLSGVNIFDKIRVALGAALPFWGIGDEVTMATRGPFGGKIVMAQYFSLVIFLSFAKLLASGKLRNTIKWTIIFFFIFLALFFTLTRASIVSVTAIFLLSVFLLNLKVINKKRRRNILIIVLFGIIAAYLTPQFIDTSRIIRRFDIFRHLDDISIASVGGRISTLKAIMPAILKLDRFILGYGPGVVEKYNILGSEMIEIAGLNYIYGWTLTIYHVFILESGILAILLFLLIICISLSYLIRTVKEKLYNDKKRIMSYGLLLAFVAYSLSMFGAHFKDTFFLFFCITRNCTNSHRKQNYVIKNVSHEK